MSWPVNVFLTLVSCLCVTQCLAYISLVSISLKLVVLLNVSISFSHMMQSLKLHVLKLTRNVDELKLQLVSYCVSPLVLFHLSPVRLCI